jgi:hypothetical protein
MTDNKNSTHKANRHYAIAQDYQTDACGFGYETIPVPMKLWDGRGWTTDKAKAMRFGNSPRARMLAQAILGRIKIVVL